MKNYIILLLAHMGVLTAVPASATVYMIGDDDGFGVGVPKNGDHPFLGDGTKIYDNRSDSEKASTNGAQYTDTYSTAHPGYSPQDGSVATFIFSDLKSDWTEGAITFNMADFQHHTYGGPIVTYDGIAQNWAFEDGFPHTRVRSFNLQHDVIDSINKLGSLTVKIDRNGSSDFYGFDYAKLTDYTIIAGDNAVPEPATWALMVLGLGIVGYTLRRSSGRYVRAQIA